MLEKLILFIPAVFAWAIYWMNCDKRTVWKLVASFLMLFAAINFCTFFIVWLKGSSVNFGNLTKLFMMKFILVGCAEGVVFSMLLAKFRFDGMNVDININKKSICDKIPKIAFICYVLYIIFTIYNDMRFFDFSYEERKSYYTTNGNPQSVLFYILLKIAFCLLIFIFFRFVSQLIVKSLKGDEASCKKIKIYMMFMLCYIIVLFFVYPGIWKCNNCDELKLLSFTKRLQVQYHQGVVSSLCYLFGLMCYPKPAMVVLFQLTIGSVLLGNIFFDLSEKSKKASIAFAILIFSPASLYMAVYPLRMYLFSVLFLTFIHCLVKAMYDEALDKILFWKMTLAVCILINTRIEAMFLLLAYPILLIKYCARTKVLVATACLVISVFIGSGINKLGNHACSMAHNTLMFGAPLSMFLADRGGG